MRREGYNVTVQGAELIGGLSQGIEQSHVAWHLACRHYETGAVGGPLDAVDSAILRLRNRTRYRAVKVHDEQTGVAVVGGPRCVYIAEVGREEGMRSRGQREGTWMFEQEACLQRVVSRTSYTP